MTALTEATPDEPPPPFVAVEISPRTSSLPGDEVVDGARRGRRWKGVWRWGGKTKKAAPGSSSSLSPAPASVIWPILRFIFFLAMLIGSAVGYAVSLSRFNASAKTTPDPTKPDQDDEMASTPLFLHACFGMALLLELVGCWRTFRTLVRIRLYKRPSVDGWLPPEEITAAEATTGAPTGASGSLPPTPRFVRALFGAAPKQSPPPTLPTYQSALQQSARQAARREAQVRSSFLPMLTQR